MHACTTCGTRLREIAAKPREAPGEVFPSAAWIEDEALPVAAGARVVVFSAPPLLEPVADSNGGTSRDVEHDPLARRAVDVARRSSSARSTATARPTPRPPWRLKSGAGAARRGAAPRRARVGRGRPAPRAPRRERSRPRSRSSSATCSRRCSPAGSGGSRRPRSGSRAAGSTSPSSTTRRTSSASSPGRSTACGCASPRSTGRAPSSSPTRRTSCGRRSSRWRASWSCSTRPRSTTATREEFLAEMRGQVERLTKLATDLLDLSRIDAGRLAVADDAIDLGDRRRRPRRRARPAGRGGEPPARARRGRPGACAGRRGPRAPDRPHPGRERHRPHSARDDGDARSRASSEAARPCRCRTTGPGFRKTRTTPCSTGSSGSAARWRPAAGSGWRSRASSRELMGGSLELALDAPARPASSSCSRPTRPRNGRLVPARKG